MNDPGYERKIEFLSSYSKVKKGNQLGYKLNIERLERKEKEYRLFLQDLKDLGSHIVPIGVELRSKLELNPKNQSNGLVETETSFEGEDLDIVEEGDDEEFDDEDFDVIDEVE